MEHHCKNPSGHVGLEPASPVKVNIYDIYSRVPDHHASSKKRMHQAQS